MTGTMGSQRALCLALVAVWALSPPAAQEEPLLPKTLSGVWLKTPGKKLTGDLILTEDGLEFDSRKRQVFIPFDEVDLLGFGRLPGDVDTDWAILRVVEDGLYRRYAIRDGRRFGYGTRTVEIYRLLREVMEAQRAGQFRTAEGHQALTLFDTQFTTEYPDDWHVSHRELIESDRDGFFGTAVIADVELAPDAAELPPGAFVFHRRPAAKGMVCEGFGKRGLEALAAVLEELGLVGADLDRTAPAPLGGCAGLLVTLGDSEIRIAADGVTVAVLELPGYRDLSAKERAAYDHAVAAFKFAWGY